MTTAVRCASHRRFRFTMMCAFLLFIIITFSFISPNNYSTINLASNINFVGVEVNGKFRLDPEGSFLFKFY